MRQQVTASIGWPRCTASLVARRACTRPDNLVLPCRLPACADVDKKAIIATATLVVELKFIRGCSKCGHIEDVVVDSTYRGHRLGLRVIEALMTAAQARDCLGAGWQRVVMQQRDSKPAAGI